MWNRVIDLFVSIVLLPILIPIMAIEAIAILIESGSPCMFNQERVGKDGAPFVMYKFRTMLSLEKCKKNIGTPIPDSERITFLGNFLRKSSIDELPQIFNILKGEMSLVGPRPTLQYQVDRYDDFQRRRLEVKPGITGLAQINGRNNLAWEEKIKLDVKYVDSKSLLLDLKILILTVVTLIKREGVEFTKNDDISRLD